MENIENYTLIDQNLARAIVRKNDDNTAHLFKIDDITSTYTYWCTFDEWWMSLEHENVEKAATQYFAWLNRIAI